MYTAVFQKKEATKLLEHTGSLYVWVTPKINTKVNLAFPI